MPEGRPAIPAALDRAVRVEAGHRCAITTCRATSGLQTHHIDDWAKVKEHRFENLILICANCHARITSGDIDRKSVLAYKANLGLLRGRYGDLERRVLERFAKDPNLEEIEIDRSHALLLEYLVSDGLLVPAGVADGALWVGDGAPQEDVSAHGLYGPFLWKLTDAGHAFVARLREAEALE